MANITGDNTDEIINGTGGADTLIGSGGDDTINGGNGNDVLIGDLIDPFEIPSSPLSGGNINDPATIPARLSGSENLTTGQLLSSGKKGGDFDFDDDREGGIRNDIRITDSSNLSGNYDFKFPGGGSGDGVSDIARFDLSTFEDNFSIEVLSEDGSDDNNAFDVDSGPQDLIILEGVLSITDSGGIATVVYEGSDGGSYTMEIDYNSARILAFGPDGTPTDFTFKDSINGGAGNDIIDGGLGNDVIDGGTGLDTIISSVGDDVIDGGTGIDTYDASGDFAESTNVAGTSGPNINDPATIPGRLAGSENLTTSQLLDSGKKGDAFDFTDDREGGIRNDIRITDSSNLSGNYDFKFPGGGSGDGVSDIARFDLSTFDDNFSIEVLSEDGSDDNNAFDIDSGPQDLIILQDVISITDSGGIATVVYQGSDGGSYTMEIDYNSARILAYGTEGELIDGDIIDSIDVTVGTTGVDDANLANYGDGTVEKSFASGADGTSGTDTIQSVENFVANEVSGEIDTITLTSAVRAGDVTISDSAIGTFTEADSGTVTAFGGAGQPTINDLLNGQESLRDGTWSINSGTEEGEVGGITFENFETINFETVCFVRGTMIETAEGQKAIEHITVGDMVNTMDHGVQPVRWIGSSKVKGQGISAPILIRKGALGNDRDLWVSPQHRMFLSGWQLELLFAEPEALVPAKMLVNDSTILQVELPEVEYFHVMFDDHEIIFAEGSPSESFHPGRMGMGTFSTDTCEEIFRLFPKLEADLLSYGPSARYSLKAYEAKILVNGSDMFSESIVL
jgi:hypothetical protein